MPNISNIDFTFGDRRLVGQPMAREQLEKILKSDRVSHAYLFSGPSGVGKTAFALAFAEIVNGVDHFTDLRGEAFSKKSSWFTHPDIHLFLPIPSNVSVDELRSRLELLKEDPYEVVDFSLRPSITGSDDSKNRRAFYPIDYFRDEIKPVARLKPNEGRKTVVILKDVEKMRAETANAFLKLLEEPSDNLIFILTTQNTEALLSTIISRCQLIRLTPLKSNVIQKALVEMDGYGEDEAQYLARIAGGNYAITRFFDAEDLKSIRESIVEYLRYAYVHDARKIIQTAQDWQSEQNFEGQVAILNIMEMFIRDLMTYRDTGDKALLTNVDQFEVIRNFCERLSDAKLPQMIEQVNNCKPMIYQNVKPKMIFTVLALRLSSLMRGKEPAIPDREPWKHLPAYSD